MKFPYFVLFYLHLLSTVCAVRLPRNFKRSFVGLGCMGTYDKAMFARLNRLCEDCYQLFKEAQVHKDCRSNCFKNDIFVKCIEILLLDNKEESLQEMVRQLYG